MLLSGAAGGLWYVQHLKAENEILTLNNEKLNGAVEQQQALIQQQLRDIESKTAINKVLSENRDITISPRFYAKDQLMIQNDLDRFLVKECNQP